MMLPPKVSRSTIAAHGRGSVKVFVLLVALLEAGELCVCDLAAVTGMSESAVSHALRLLRAHRVVSVNRRGRMAFYRLDDGHVRMLLDDADVRGRCWWTWDFHLGCSYGSGVTQTCR